MGEDAGAAEAAVALGVAVNPGNAAVTVPQTCTPPRVMTVVSAVKFPLNQMEKSPFFAAPVLGSPKGDPVTVSTRLAPPVLPSMAIHIATN